MLVNAPQRVLLVCAASLASLGLLAHLMAPLELRAHTIGCGAAAALAFCGLLAGWLDRRRALAMGAIDAALIVLAVMTAAFLRLALGRLERPGGQATALIGVAMAAVCALGLLALAASRPRRSRRDGWAVSPLLSLPVLITALTVVGFLTTSSRRLPREAAGGPVEAARRAAPPEPDSPGARTVPSRGFSIATPIDVEAVMPPIPDAAPRRRRDPSREYRIDWEGRSPREPDDGG